MVGRVLLFVLWMLFLMAGSGSHCWRVSPCVSIRDLCSVVEERPSHLPPGSVGIKITTPKPGQLWPLIFLEPRAGLSEQEIQTQMTAQKHWFQVSNKERLEDLELDFQLPQLPNVKAVVTHLDILLFNVTHVGEFMGKNFPYLREMTFGVRNSVMDDTHTFSGLPLLQKITFITFPLHTNCFPDMPKVPDIFAPFGRGNGTLQTLRVKAPYEDLSLWRLSRLEGLQVFYWMQNYACDYPRPDWEVAENDDGPLSVVTEQRPQRLLLFPRSITYLNFFNEARYMREWLCEFYKSLKKSTSGLTSSSSFPLFSNSASAQINASYNLSLLAFGSFNDSKECLGMLDLLPLPPCFAPERTKLPFCNVRDPTKVGRTDLHANGVSQDFFRNMVNVPRVVVGIAMRLLSFGAMNRIEIPAHIRNVELEFVDKKPRTIVLNKECLRSACHHIDIRDPRNTGQNVVSVEFPLSNATTSAPSLGTPPQSNLAYLYFWSVNISGPEMTLLLSSYRHPRLEKIFCVMCCFKELQALFAPSPRLSLADDPSGPCNNNLPYEPLRPVLNHVAFKFSPFSNAKPHSPIVLSRGSFCEQRAIIWLDYFDAPIDSIAKHAFADVSLSTLRLDGNNITTLEPQVFGEKTIGVDVELTGQKFRNITDSLYSLDIQDKWFARRAIFSLCNLSAFNQRSLGSPLCRESSEWLCDGLRGDKVSLGLDRNILTDMNITWWKIFAIPNPIGTPSVTHELGLSANENIISSIRVNDDLMPYGGEPDESGRNMTDLYLRFSNAPGEPYTGFEFAVAGRLKIRISLKNNRMETIAAESFSNIRSLTLLDLGSNRIDRVEAMYLSGKTCLGHGCKVDLRNNLFNDNSVKGLLKTNSSISSLVLRNNSLTEFPYEVVQLMENVENIWIRPSGEETIPVFYLDLSHNNISSVDKSVCSSLSRNSNSKWAILYIDVSYNDVIHLGDDAFACENVYLFFNANGNSKLFSLPHERGAIVAVGINGTRVVEENLHCTYTQIGKKDQMNVSFSSLLSPHSTGNNVLTKCCNLFRTRNFHHVDFDTLTSAENVECKFRHWLSLSTESAVSDNDALKETNCKWGNSTVKFAEFETLVITDPTVCGRCEMVVDTPLLVKSANRTLLVLLVLVALVLYAASLPISMMYSKKKWSLDEEEYIEYICAVSAPVGHPKRISAPLSLTSSMDNAYLPHQQNIIHNVKNRNAFSDDNEYIEPNLPEKEYEEYEYDHVYQYEYKTV
eukprot:Nk52_evm7s216 gene=Nk52_evmTU7s216